MGSDRRITNENTGAAHLGAPEKRKSLQGKAQEAQLFRALSSFLSTSVGPSTNFSSKEQASRSWRVRLARSLLARWKQSS